MLSSQEPVSPGKTAALAMGFHLRGGQHSAERLLTAFDLRWCLTRKWPEIWRHPLWLVSS
jgi:hypothetical protein